MSFPCVSAYDILIKVKIIWIYICKNNTIKKSLILMSRHISNKSKKIALKLRYETGMFPIIVVEF